ncbi:hypothetical protein BDF20DRAFT_918405 [Mycotypha africana]|uniref:uncharacterized protein n=1 Tax=Mycotypha africana TaxID=64632 RepID=UPI002300D78E|nr:uncharacterized protein BDF20DRAFT_918405 [Mycotypha africana]KAI8990840.1 hypothetical protein BDF20DRAFT_918405 [Mycotypha africana]
MTEKQSKKSNYGEDTRWLQTIQPIADSSTLRPRYEAGMSARAAILCLGIAVRIGQKYVKDYKDQNDSEFLPGRTKKHGGGSRQFEPDHTAFLIDYYKKHSNAGFMAGKECTCGAVSRLSGFLGIRTSTLSRKMQLTLKRLYKMVGSRTSDRTIHLRQSILSEWITDPKMDFMSNCVFVDEAGFNMHLCRNFGRYQKKALELGLSSLIMAV